MSFADRCLHFRETVARQADLVMFPISADLQYLTGLPRDLPTFGAVLHPGIWLEGLWMTPASGPVLVLARMSAEFGGLIPADLDVRIIGDNDDPILMIRDLLQEFNVPDNPRIAVGDRTYAETLICLQGLRPDIQFSSASELLRPQRMIKNEAEIALMRQAGQITEAAYRDTLPLLKYGMTELDLISELNHQLRRHGSLGESFTTSLYTVGPDHEMLFGQREKTMPRRLDPPVSILTDFGAICQGYCYDYGRTIYFGEPDPELQHVFDLVMAAQACGIRAMKADQVTAGQIDAVARQVIAVAGFGADFRHRLGHGIGLDVHEPPFLAAGDDTVLREGMLFTVEPSIFFEGRCSARVEDVIVVRPDGGEALTSGFQDLSIV